MRIWPGLALALAASTAWARPTPLTTTVTGIVANCNLTPGTVIMTFVPTPGTGDGQPVHYNYIGSTDFILYGTSLMIGPSGIAPANCGLAETITITGVQSGHSYNNQITCMKLPDPTAP